VKVTAVLVRGVASDPVALSADFLLAVRYGESTRWATEALAALEAGSLAAALGTDAARLAFWCNLYNAAAQRTLATEPDLYESRRRFFGTALVTVAGTPLSLDAIEHRILRRGYSKWTLGYLRRPLRTAVYDRWAPAERDPRIHFALNCGAESCPPIAAYTREAVDEQLDLATAGYLDRTVDYDPDAGRVTVPRVMLWFRGDWGRKRDILAFLRRYDQVPAGVSPRLSYREWDWSLEPGAYATDRLAARGRSE
jgi:hypothetical protein